MSASSDKTSTGWSRLPPLRPSSSADQRPRERPSSRGSSRKTAKGLDEKGRRSAELWKRSSYSEDSVDVDSDEATEPSARHSPLSRAPSAPLFRGDRDSPSVAMESTLTPTKKKKPVGGIQLEPLERGLSREVSLIASEREGESRSSLLGSERKDKREKREATRSKRERERLAKRESKRETERDNEERRGADELRRSDEKRREEREGIEKCSERESESKSKSKSKSKEDESESVTTAESPLALTSRSSSPSSSLSDEDLFADLPRDFVMPDLSFLGMPPSLRRRETTNKRTKEDKRETTTRQKEEVDEGASGRFEKESKVREETEREFERHVAISTGNLQNSRVSSGPSLSLDLSKLSGRAETRRKEREATSPSPSSSSVVSAEQTEIEKQLFALRFLESDSDPATLLTARREVRPSFSFRSSFSSFLFLCSEVFCLCI